MTPRRVKAIMTRDVTMLAPRQPMRDAVGAMVRAGAEIALVADGTRLVGVLTDGDCLAPSLGAGYYREWRGHVDDHMTPDPVTIPASAEIAAAGRAFLDHPYRALPVTEGDRAIGLLTRAALVAFLIRFT